MKWRLFYARLDKVLYIASKQCILDDLLAALSSREQLPSRPTPLPGQGTESREWRSVRPDGPCHDPRAARALEGRAARVSLGLGRGQPAGVPGESRPVVERGPGDGCDPEYRVPGATRSGNVQRQADRLFAVHFYCPDGGKYELSADGKRVTCSVHGSAEAPRQLAAGGRQPHGPAAQRVRRRDRGLDLPRRRPARRGHDRAEMILDAASGAMLEKKMGEKKMIFLSPIFLSSRD